ncbi:hypothetical protein [Geothrix fuzhouensis]|uniref:hypothetical protein n=1 Tax=Geothrix fuzhouensis TaxID=2966451 RepID=UPI0021476AC0|nr:hypothetical protein [Geothrix fuzhouensis]
MLNILMICLLALVPGEATPPLEPNGVRASGNLPAFQGDPAPPDWLRLDSQVLADPDCRHYGYEVYAGDTQWLVRYVMFPEEREDFREIEQIFLFPRAKGRAKVARIAPAELQIEPLAVRWKGQIFRLVDRRDLVRE